MKAFTPMALCSP